MAETLSNVLEVLVAKARIDKDSFVLVVDDGSNDESYDELLKLQRRFNWIRAIRLDRNRGHQIALIAGMDEAHTNCDIMITIDCDMQQDPNAIPNFVEEYLKGNEIVLGIRRSRETDGLVKSFMARAYRSLLRSMMINYRQGHSDYRLVSSNAYSTLQRELWVNQFLRGAFSDTSLSSSTVVHDVFERRFGSSKYSVGKMTKLATEGVMSNAMRTLRFLGMIGLFGSFVSLLLGIYVFVAKLLFQPVAGWSSILLAVCFFGGITIFCQCLLSEAIIRILKIFLGGRPYRLLSDK